MIFLKQMKMKINNKALRLQIGKENKLINVLTLIRSTTRRTCAITATIARARQKWLMLVSTKRGLITQVECAKIATWLSIT